MKQVVVTALLSMAAFVTAFSASAQAEDEIREDAAGCKKQCYPTTVPVTHTAYLLSGRPRMFPPCRNKIYLLTFVRLVIYPFSTMRGGMKTAKLTALALAFFLCFGWIQPSLLFLCLASGQNDMKNCSHCENMSMKTADKACSKSAAPEQEDAGAGDSCSMQACYAPQTLLGADMPQLSFLVPQVALLIPRADILVSSMHVNDLFRPPAPSAA